MGPKLNASETTENNPCLSLPVGIVDPLDPVESEPDPCNEPLPSLQGSLISPLDAVKSVPTALRTHLLLESEARTAALALVWMGFVTVTARECRFDAAQSAHCECLPWRLLTGHNLKAFSYRVTTVRNTNRTDSG